jgi:hypothetical protein
MLVMLSVKSRVDALARAWPAFAGKWWWSCTRLKLAVPVNQPTRFQSGSRRDEITYSLALEPEGQKAITGWVKVVDGPEPSAAEMVLTMTREEVAARLAAFRSAFPEVTPAWVAMDAVLFRVFLQHGIGEAVRRHGVNLAEDGWDALIGSGKVLLQTTHEVRLDDRFFASDFTPRPLDVLVLPSETSEVGSDSIVTCRWLVRHADAPVMQTEIRIIVRSTSQEKETP